VAKIFYARVDEFWRREEKYAYLEEAGHVGGVEWQELQPDAKHNWLTQGLERDFDDLVPLGSKDSNVEETIFMEFGPGVMTGRDSLVFGFDPDEISSRIQKFCDLYNAEVHRYTHKGKPTDIDNFLTYESIKWSRNLKRDLAKQRLLTFDVGNIRNSIYRPFTCKKLYFSKTVIDEVGQSKYIFPSEDSEVENKAIAVCVHSQVPFSSLAISNIPSMDIGGRPSQSFPFYTYDEDGANRRENVTDWALEKFRAQYADPSISKWDIFHYVYALLHHPQYRERYAANLKRELPRLPFAPDFRAFAEAGKALAELHVNYEQLPEYPLERTEQPGAALDWRVERMKLSKDRRSLVYNDFLTLSGIPTEAFEYRLGNRSALEWIVDQYRTTTDSRSGITNDPNRADDPQYVVRLVGQVVHVSVETVRIVNALPDLGLDPTA
jgi:predicted helicase